LLLLVHNFIIPKYTDLDRSFLKQNENCPEKVTEHSTADAIKYEGMDENNNIKVKNYYFTPFYLFYIYSATEERKDRVNKQ
jgi:hypothetical protein